MSSHDHPVYPQLTKEQHAVLAAMTTQRCANWMEAMDFIADLSPEAKDFLKNADKEKIAELKASMDFHSASKTIWKFFWIGGTMLIGGLQIWKAFGEYITVKFK